MNLHRFRVLAFDGQGWEPRGSVLLPDFAHERDVEHALAAVGVYAPRGQDYVSWRVSADDSAAIVFDGADHPMVRLIAA